MEKTRSENVLGKVDWFQVICTDIHWSEIFQELLKIDLTCVMTSAGFLKHEEYDVVYSCGSIRYFTFSDSEKSYERGTLVMSGQACTLYEWAILAGKRDCFVFQELFWRMIERAMNSHFNFDVSRLDLALDDYNEKPYFAIDTIIGKVRRKHYLSKGRSQKVIDSEFDKKTRAKTQQIGTRGSDTLFRFYEKNKELARSYSGEKQEEVLSLAPGIRLEAETRHEVGMSLVQAIANLGKTSELVNLIRGFVKSALTFYTDGNYKKVCRWWQEFLTPCLVPNIYRCYADSEFEQTKHWYEFKGGLSVTQALLFFAGQGIEVQPHLITIQEDFMWSKDMADKMISLAAREERIDLIPMIEARTRKAPHCH